MRKTAQSGFTPVILIVIAAAIGLGAWFFLQKPTSSSLPSLTTKPESNKQETNEPGVVWSYQNEVAFDGEKDVVEFPKTAIEKVTGLKKGTISLWFKFKKGEDKQFLPILYLGKGKGKGLGNNLVIEIGHYDYGGPPNTKLYYTFYNANFEPFLCFDSGENLLPDTWYHFVAVNSEKGNTGYLNGKELTNRHYNFSNAKDSRFIADVPIKDVFYLGYGWFGIDEKWHYFNGGIKDVKVFDQALTSQQIAQMK